MTRFMMPSRVEIYEAYLRGEDAVCGRLVIGDLMIALGIPIPIYGLRAYKRLARLLFPLVSYFPMSMLFYGSGGAEHEPKYEKYFAASDLLASDFLFMRSTCPKT